MKKLSDIETQEKFERVFPTLCKPRKTHECRLCGNLIQIKEPCCRWSGVTQGEGFWTSHAHPECYKETIQYRWDEGDWERFFPGDMDRPNKLEDQPK